jgi:transposase
VIRIALNPAQQTELETVFAQTQDRKLRDRVQIVQMAQRGRPHGQIATDLGVTPRTVQRHLNTYLAHGVAGLVPRKPPGAKPKIPEALAPEIQQWVIGGPPSQGLDRANWTYESLAAHLGHVHGIKVKKSAMHEFCQRHDIRPYRPTYRFLRGDPDKQQRAAHDLAALKKGLKTAS